RTVSLRWPLLAAYLLVVGAAAAWWLLDHPGLGTEIFPQVDTGQFQLRLRAPTGTYFTVTEELTRESLDAVSEAAGRDNVEVSIAYVGVVPASYPINSVYLWMGGPEESVLRVALKRGSGVRVEELKERLRHDLPPRLQESLRRKLVAAGRDEDE